MGGKASAENGKRGGRPTGAKSKHTLAKEAAEAAQLAEVGLSAARVIEEVRRLAMVDVRSFFNEDGTAKRPQDWTAEQGAAIAGFEVLKKNTAAGDGVTDTIHKFRLWDKTRALEMLAKHFGLLVERLEHSGDIRILHELPE